MNALSKFKSLHLKFRTLCPLLLLLFGSFQALAEDKLTLVASAIFGNVEEEVFGYTFPEEVTSRFKVVNLADPDDPDEFVAVWRVNASEADVFWGGGMGVWRPIQDLPENTELSALSFIGRIVAVGIHNPDRAEARFRLEFKNTGTDKTILELRSPPFPLTEVWQEVTFPQLDTWRPGEGNWDTSQIDGVIFWLDVSNGMEAFDRNADARIGLQSLELFYQAPTEERLLPKPTLFPAAQN